MSSSTLSHFSLTLASHWRLCSSLNSFGVRLPRVRPAKNLIRVIGKLRQSAATAFSSLTVLVPPLLLQNCAKSGALFLYRAAFGLSDCLLGRRLGNREPATPQKEFHTPSFGRPLLIQR